MIIWRMARVVADVDATVLPDGDSTRVSNSIHQPTLLCLLWFWLQNKTPKEFFWCCSVILSASFSFNFPILVNCLNNLIENVRLPARRLTYLRLSLVCFRFYLISNWQMASQMNSLFDVSFCAHFRTKNALFLNLLGCCRVSHGFLS